MRCKQNLVEIFAGASGMNEKGSSPQSSFGTPNPTYAEVVTLPFVWSYWPLSTLLGIGW
jgi:hypothetical protein